MMNYEIPCPTTDKTSGRGRRPEAARRQAGGRRAGGQAKQAKRQADGRPSQAGGRPSQQASRAPARKASARPGRHAGQQASSKAGEAKPKREICQARYNLVIKRPRSKNHQRQQQSSHRAWPRRPKDRIPQASRRRLKWGASSMAIYMWQRPINS